MRTKEKKKLQVKMNDVITSIGDVVAKSKESKVDVSNLPTGVYFVKATIDGVNAVKKLVVTK